MVKVEKGEFYVASSGQLFFNLIEALNHDRDCPSSRQCAHNTTRDELVTLQITSNEGKKEDRKVLVCAECDKILRMG